MEQYEADLTRKWFFHALPGVNSQDGLPPRFGDTGLPMTRLLLGRQSTMTTGVPQEPGCEACRIKPYSLQSRSMLVVKVLEH